MYTLTGNGAAVSAVKFELTDDMNASRGAEVFFFFLGGGFLTASWGCTEIPRRCRLAQKESSLRIF